MWALFEMSAKMGISRKKLAVLASAIGFVFYGHLCTMHFVQEQQQQQKKATFNFLKRALTTSGAAILFCLVAMQRSVSDSESAPNTVTKRHKALFCNVPLHSEVLRSALQRSPYATHPGFNCIFSITSEAMWPTFGIYEHLVIVYPVYVFYDR